MALAPEDQGALIGSGLVTNPTQIAAARAILIARTKNASPSSGYRPWDSYQTGLINDPNVYALGSRTVEPGDRNIIGGTTNPTLQDYYARFWDQQRANQLTRAHNGTGTLTPTPLTPAEGILTGAI